MNQHKQKSEEAQKIMQMGNIRQEEYNKQVQELQEQHSLRIQFLVEENSKKSNRETLRLQKELASREKALDGLKDRLRQLEEDDGLLTFKIDSLKREKSRYLELEKNEKLLKHEIQTVEKELSLAEEALK